MQFLGLKELVQYVNEAVPSFEEVLAKRKNKKYYKLFYLLARANYDEETVITKLYPKIEKRNQFKVLKKRFSDLCIEAISTQGLLENTTLSAFQKKYQSIISTYCFYRRLIGEGKSKIALPVMESLLKKTINFDLIELTVIILNDLKFYYGLIFYNSGKHKFNQFITLHIEYSFRLNLLNQITSIYVQLANIIIHTKKSERSDKLDRLLFDLNKVKDKIENIDSFHLRYYLYSSEYFISLRNDDKESQVKLLTKALIYFEKKNHLKKNALFVFTQRRGLSNLTLNNFVQGLTDFSRCFEMLLPTQILEKQYTYRYIFLTHILQQHYQQAYEDLCNVINDPKLKKLDVSFREPWYLNEAFIHFLIKTGKIDPALSPNHKLKRFSLGKFMNEMTVFSKDKRGLNITINIIQMLFLIINEKYDAMLDKLNSLKQYNHKYLRKPEYIRSSSFIKMLQKIPAGNYNAKQIQKKAEKYHTQLIENPMDFSEHSLSIEIIPYERLWEEVLSLFD